MNMTHGNMNMEPVLHSFAYCLDFLREQVADVSEADMTAQPNGIKNHPAWIMGHIAFACQSLGRAIGLPHWLSRDWSTRFGTGSVPVAAADVYGTKEELLAILAETQSRMTEAVKQMDDSQLDQPFPVESYLPVFPTIRHAVTQVLIGHTANHIGQLSVWRRGMNLPPMRRGFE